MNKEENQAADKQISTTYTFELAKAAAFWWAQYLPGYKPVAINEINKFSRITEPTNLDSLSILNQQHRENDVNREQFDNFVYILATKMLARGFPDSGCLRIGHVSSYEPPAMMQEALDEAGMRLSAFGLFPYKTEMKIYLTGHIIVNNELVILDSRVTHYEKAEDLDFSNSPSIKIKGGDFRIVEIKIGDLKGDLYELCGWGGNVAKKLDISDAFNHNWTKNDGYVCTESLFIKIPISYVKGGMTQLRTLSDQDLISILQNPNRMKEIFNDNTSLFYKIKIESCLKDDAYGNIGKVTVEPLGDNYYTYSTKVVKVKEVPQECANHVCTILSCYNGIVTLNPGDFLLAVKEDSQLNYFPKSMQDDFAGFLCENAECTSVSNEPFIPYPDTTVLGADGAQLVEASA